MSDGKKTHRTERLPWKTEYTDALIFGLLLIVFSAVTVTLFYRQASAGGDKLFESDMKAYMLEMQGLDSGYSFPYPVYFKLAAFFHLFVSPQWAVALAAMLLNSLSVVVVKLHFNHVYRNGQTREEPVSDGGRDLGIRVLLSLLALSLFLISMLYLPYRFSLPGIHHRYTGVFTANPFHNATYMAARPFAVLSFLQFVRLLDRYETEWIGNVAGKFTERGKAGAQKDQKNQKDQERGFPWDYILFALYLLLATMTKPSFTIVLVAVAGLIMVWRLVKNRFRTLVPTVWLGLTFIPTFLDLLYQYKGVFVPTAEEVERGIGFGPGRVWANYCDNIPLAICLAVGFPLLVLLLHFKELKSNTLFRFSWQIYLCGFVSAFVLYEKGFREVDFNFSWGYMYGIFFAFVGVLSVLIPATLKKEKPLLLTLQWLAYLAHLICGVLYFVHIFGGGAYY